MIDPVKLFVQGGPFVALLLCMGLGHASLCVLQLATCKKLDLLPLLWAGIGAILCTGLLGTALGQLEAYNAVAVASAEMKSALLAQGMSLALQTSAVALAICGVQVVLTGAVHSAVRTARMRQAAASD